jgi:amidase
MNDDLAWMDATAQADLVRQGSASPSELVEAAINRIEKVNPELNAVIHDLSDKAAAQAASGEVGNGPFRGVPMLMKDGLCHTAGDPFHNGMRALKEAGWREDNDTWLAARYRAAGFVFCGKTNLPELATTITTEPLAYGPTRNPWNTEYSTGGSSGGAGAAVAAGLVPVAHGNDMGGSIRFPAAHCGVVGLKPTRARNTLGPDFGEFWGPVTHEHVLTRSVRDTAAVLDATAGPGVGDPYTAPAPARPWQDEVGADPGRLRIGFRTLRRDGAGESHAECVAAVQAAARALEGLGRLVEPAALEALDHPAMSESMPMVFSSVVARDVERWSARLGRPIADDELEPMNAVLAEMGRAITATQYLAAVEGLQSWTRGVAAWWEDHDVLVTPVSPEPPPPLGLLAPDAKDGFSLLIDTGAWVTFTFPFNITGQPAISLPLHWTADGLPVGVQLVAAAGREDVLIRVASQLEQAVPWADQHPPVSA